MADGPIWINQWGRSLFPCNDLLPAMGIPFLRPSEQGQIGGSQGLSDEAGPSDAGDGVHPALKSTIRFSGPHRYEDYPIQFLWGFLLGQG